MMHRFKLLFSLEVRHDYLGGVWPDIGFVIPDDTARVLRGAGMLAKPVDGVLYVVFRADDAGAPARSVAGKTLRIGLVARDPDFANITEGFNPASGALYYRNHAVATALDDPPAKLAPGDLDPALAREAAFAVVDIAIDAASYTGARSFQIRLKARVETLRYYVVLKGFSNGDSDLVAVRDHASGPDELKFDKVAPAQLTADEKSRSDLLATDGAKVLVFRSLAAVPRRQVAARQFQLMRNTEAVIDRLPQPGKGRGTADLIVQLSKSKP